MKRPSFQFYPADWLRDTALRSCSIGARGLWIDMLCFMHEGNPYGHLKVGNKVILAPNLSGMVGATLDDVEGWLDELRQAGVYDIAEDGSMQSRRMIKDENLRNMRAAGGKLGGNPALKDNHKVNLKVDSEVKQKPTPSSSSSSSSSKEIIQAPEGVSIQVWQDFQKLRKNLKAQITQTAIEGIKREADKAGWPIEDALKECCARGWRGFKADWVNGQQNRFQTIASPPPSFKAPDAAAITRAELDERDKGVVPIPREIRAKIAEITNKMTGKVA